jgi:hypothetical protein
MGDWYTIGLALGLGVAIGILAAGIFPRRFVAPVLAAALGVGLGLLVENWQEAVAGLLGGVAGALGASPIVRGALRRGGTRAGIALLVAAAALVVAALAFVPVLGYIQAVALPALGRRLRSREPERHAGLRTLARD